MLPTLSGRIQTRIFALLFFGGIWTAIITPALPTHASLSQSYKATYIILLTVTVLGIVWEFIYHGLQQFRWEKDWPTLFGLVTAINEGLVVWALLAGGDVPGLKHGVTGPAFTIDFVTVWLLVWLMTNGPMRVPFIRWRFHGGRVIG